jgi:catechol 2,3-dioxygenase-like lactoylglutathione lyase family enzyme
MIGKVGLVVLTAILVSSVFTASGTAVSASPAEVWNVTWDGSRFDKGCAVATSGDSVYMAGTSTIVDSHTNLTSALTTPTAFLNKYDKDGNFVWNVLYEENSTGIDVSAVATAGDSVYMAGTVSSTVTGNVTGYFWNITEDAFLNKYNSDGNIIWNITWGGGPGTYSANAAATSGDYVYLANMMPLLSSNASSSNFLNKYDSDGNLIWNVTWAQMDYEMEAKVAAISGGCVYLAGETVDIGAFLVKYDGDGNLILSRNITCGGGVEAIATGDNAVYLAGNGPHGAFLNKYDSVGNFIWNTTWGEWPTQGSAIATSGNSVYLTGFDIVGTNIFHYTFLNKYNSADGKLIWNVTWGGTSATGGGATAMTEDGVYLAGTIWRDPYTPGTDAFLVKFSEPALTPTPTQTVTPTPTPTPVGTQPAEVWNVTWGGTDFAEGYAIATTGDNAMYLAGAIDFKDAFLNKYNSTDGKLIWNVTRGGSGKAIATGDNAVYLTGHTPDWKAFLNKYDNGGNLIWNKTLEILGTSDVEGSAIATSGDSVYMAGSAISNSTGDVENFLNRYDSDGNLIWNRTLETGGVAASVAASGDGVYMVGGALLYKAFLDKYDSDGNLIWNRTWGGDGKATATGDNAVYMAGTTPVSPGTFLNKYDDDGNLIWHITCRGKGNSVATRDNAVYLAGTTAAPGVFLNKYSSTDGNLIWGIIRGGKDTSDGMTAITGDSVYLAGSNVYNISLVKFSDPASTPAPIVSPASAAQAVPGFEAIFAIMGLLAVAYLVMVRRK